MARVKGGPKASKRRKNILKAAKGYRFARSTKKRSAIDALRHAGKHAFAHRRDKKNDRRQVNIVRLNAALKERGYKNYSTFIGALKKGKIELDRKVLAQIAENHPEMFDRILKKVA